MNDGLGPFMKSIMMIYGPITQARVKKLKQTF